MAESHGSDNRFADAPRQGWAFFEESGKWRKLPSPSGAAGSHFPKVYGDWVAVTRPAGWRPPAGTLAGETLLGDAGLTAAADRHGARGGASGDHTKIGAGRKPQPYGEHGWYAATSGGTISGGFEVRGPVTAPHTKSKGQRQPAPLGKGGKVGVSTTNDDPHKPDPKPEALSSKTREQVQRVLDKDSGTQVVNMNSGYRSGDPTAHGEGRAVDINRVNGQKISDAVDPAVPADHSANPCGNGCKQSGPLRKTTRKWKHTLIPWTAFSDPRTRTAKKMAARLMTKRNTSTGTIFTSQSASNHGRAACAFFFCWLSQSSPLAP